MKRKVFTNSVVLMLMLIVSVASAEVRFSDFDVQAINGKARITWTTSVESYVSTFKIERSTDGIDYYEVAILQPQGTNREYVHIDSDLFKQSTRTFYYRIKAESRTGIEFTEAKSVNISISGIQQTWGSLKAMFK